MFRVPRTKKEMEAFNREQAKWWRDGWLQAHPGRTAAEYNRLLRDTDSEVWQWRRAQGAAAIEAERQAWERDHPGRQYPKHLCDLTDREMSEFSPGNRRASGQR